MGVLNFGGGTGIANEELFVKQVCTVLNKGGMMSFKTADLLGHHITLLHPAELPSDGTQTVEICYNYFDDNHLENQDWDHAGFNIKTLLFDFPRQTGIGATSAVAQAVGMLYELSITNCYGFAMDDTLFVNADDTIGWLNAVLDTQFTPEKRENVWAGIQHVVSKCTNPKKLDTYSWVSGIPLLVDSFIPKHCKEATDPMELADLTYVFDRIEHLFKNEDSVKEGTYAADIIGCAHSLTCYFEKNSGIDLSKPISMDELWIIMRLARPFQELLEKPYAEREKEANDKNSLLKEVAKYSLFLPSRTLVYVLAGVVHAFDFWEEWETYDAIAYTDEHIKKYPEFKTVSQKKKSLWKTPVPSISTCKYLKHCPKYSKNDSISDMDFLYWWDGVEDIPIRKKDDLWLAGLAEQYEKCRQQQHNCKDRNGALEVFVKVLEDINFKYHNVFAFESMFDEFVEQITCTEYQAAVSLLKKFAEKDQGKRNEMKRLLAVLANKKLRNLYFGFD